MQIPEWLDLAIHLLSGTAGVAVLGLAWTLVKRLNRDESLRQDYPPHRHINGSILYPHEYRPAVVEKIPYGG